MSEKNIKLLRGQVRQAVKDHLGDELVRISEERLVKLINERLSKITDMVREGLEVVDKRSKETQAYVVRNVGVPTAPVEAAQQGEPNATQPEEQRNQG